MERDRTNVEKATESATLGAGCFWGVEVAFRQLPGVVRTEVGYAGGNTSKPTYHEVCSGRTGHAEVVRVEFDPQKVKYEDLLQVFWDNHDPTTLNRQGPDIGTQYRSVIFFHSSEQETIARESMRHLEQNGNFRRPIVTQILPVAGYFQAEDYHQQYLEKRGLASCHVPFGDG